MRHRYEVVDAFSSDPLYGNPVAVVLDADDLSTAEKQRIAAEMHLSETTFVSSLAPDADAEIRIFTPVNELPFAGHPLIGTLLVLARRTGRARLTLRTGRGLHAARVGLRPDRETALAELEQPETNGEPFAREDELLRALGVACSTLAVRLYDVGPRHVFVGLPDVDALSALRPDHSALGAFDDLAAICFAPAGDHWRMRMFSPAYGVVEDAATGSAAAPFADHLRWHGLVAPDETVHLRQGIELGRRCDMTVLSEETGGSRRTWLRGNAALVATGELRV